MKKRIACLVLALVMLVGLIPSGVVKASAAGLSVSEAGITVIKQFKTFKSTAYQVGEEYRIGYGTPSMKGATITEQKADTLLREALAEVDAVINASSLNLVQKQHDALVWFGFVYGTDGLCEAVAALGANPSSSQVANALCTLGYSAGYPDQKSDKEVILKRMQMVNLYVNGKYTLGKTGSFAMTVFDAGSGDFGSAKKMVQVYDASRMNDISVANPTLSGKSFLGWYSKNSNGSYALVTGLNTATSGKVLYARWQEGDTKVSAKYTVPAEVLYRAAAIPTSENLSVFSEVGGTKKIDYIKRNDVVTVVAEQLVGDVKWVELSTGGWIKLGKLSEIKPIVPAVTVTVIDDALFIREDASVNAKQVGTASRGDKLVVYMTEGQWGYTADGWVLLMYTDYSELSAQAAQTVVSDEKAEYSGVVSCGSLLNVRQSATAASARVGTLANGTPIKLSEITTVAGHKWGKLVGSGWVCMDYVKLNTTPSTNTNTTVSGNGVSGTIVNCENVNVRAYAGVKNILVTTLAQGTSVKVYEQAEVDGASWGRIDQGWVSLEYVKVNGTIPGASTESSTQTSFLVVVDGTLELNVRAGAGGEYDKVTSLKPGTQVEVTEKKNVNGVEWGHISSGWINLSYVVVLNTGNGAYSVGGTIVNCSKAANVRAAAGTTNALVGVAAVGSRVSVTERTSVKGVTWYNIGKGWVCGDYVKLDSEFQDPIPGQKEEENTVVDSDIIASESEGYPAVLDADAVLYANASADSQELLTIRKNAQISITARKIVNKKEYGKTTIGATIGWVDMSKLTMQKLYGVISAATVPGYKEASLRSTTEYSFVKGTNVTVVEQYFDGSILWGKVEHSSAHLWINLSGFSMFAGNKKPDGIFTQNGVGYLTGSINKNSVEIRKNENGQPGAAMDYKLTKGYSVNVTSRMYDTSSGETWGKIVVNNATCWVNMSNVDLNTVVLKTTQVVPAYTDYTGATQTDSLKKDTTLTVLERKIQSYGTGINDWGKVYVNDNASDIRYIILDEGKLAVQSKAPSDTVTTPNVQVGIVAVGKAAKNPTVVYEEADTGSKSLMEINQNANVTILNWKNYNGATWGKVQIGNVVGWVLISDVDFTGLTGNVKVSSLKIYVKADADSNYDVLETKNGSVSVKELALIGSTLWAKVSIAGQTGWIDLADVKLNAPAEEETKRVIATGTLNSVKSSVIVYADLSGTEGTVTLPKGTKVNLLDVRMSGGKAWWNVDLGSNSGWIEQTYINLNAANVTVNASVMSIFDDLVEGSKKLSSIYAGEAVTVQTFRVYDGKLYGEVAVDSTTGWLLLVNSDNSKNVTIGVGTVPVTPSNPGTEQDTPVTPVTPDQPVQGVAATIVCSGNVNVRSAAGVSNALVTTLPNGTKVTMYEETTVNGAKWVRIDQGWVCKDYVKTGVVVPAGPKTEPDIVSTVPAGAIAVGYANADLTVYGGAGYGYGKVGSVGKYNNVTIYERKLDGGVSWARVDGGWIILTSVIVTGIGSGDGGYVARCGFTVKVRTSANGTEIASALVNAPLDILETSGTWARTSLGWISTSYILQMSEMPSDGLVIG